MTDPFRNASKQSFSDALQKANDILFEKFLGQQGTHCIDCPDVNGALSLLLGLSFVSGSSFENLSCPDFARIILIAQDNGVFLIIGGILNRDQHIEIRLAADKLGLPAMSMTTADKGTSEFNEFVSAIDFLRKNLKTGIP